MVHPSDLVIEELRKFEEVQSIYKVFGDHNLLCEIYAGCRTLYELIQSKILKIPAILNVEVDILIEKIVLNPDAELDILAKKA